MAVRSMSSAGGIVAMEDRGTIAEMSDTGIIQDMVDSGGIIEGPVDDTVPDPDP